MKNLTISFFIFATSQVVFSQTLNCSFGLAFAPAEILIVKTEITENLKIGTYSMASYQGSPQKQVPNKILDKSEIELHRYQLDEGFEENNITIYVSNKQNADQSYNATAENRGSPYMKQLKGACQLSSN